MKRNFWGGVHPEEGKALTMGKAPQRLTAPERVVLPLRQHAGPACRSLVAVGDVVTVGQKLADGEGLCVPVHASVSGRVAEIGEYPHPDGGTCLAIVLENDGKDTPCPTVTAPGEPLELDNSRLLELIREAGVVGMGGAGFPTHVKGEAPVEVLIANGCECEPYLTSDDLLLQTCPEEVLRGLRVMKKLTGARRVVLALEDNKPQAQAALREKLGGQGDVEIVSLVTRYPQGSEKQLIQAVTGRQVPSGKLPRDVGCAVFNVTTLWAVSRAVYEGAPVTHRLVTLTGDGVQEPQNFWVPLGTPFGAVIAAGGGLKEKIWKVISGGPMMGVAQENLDAPVIKTTGAILCLTEAQNGEREEPVCIRCGKCVEVCPMGLTPLYLFRYGKREDFKALERLHLADCIGCGCCAYVCPGKVPLVRQFKASKKAIKEGKAG